MAWTSGGYEMFHYGHTIYMDMFLAKDGFTNEDEKNIKIFLSRGNKELGIPNIDLGDKPFIKIPLMEIQLSKKSTDRYVMVMRRIFPQKYAEFGILENIAIVRVDYNRYGDLGRGDLNDQIYNDLQNLGILNGGYEISKYLRVHDYRDRDRDDISPSYDIKDIQKLNYYPEGIVNYDSYSFPLDY